MNILTIIGSPRTNGNTYKIVRQIEIRMMSEDSMIEFENIQLSKFNLEPCKGCYACIAKGEEFCPIKDDRAILEHKIKEADAVIFASPVYTYSIPWTMKNLLDRFAYRCHRPDFQGKKSMIVITTGAVGLSFVSHFLAFMTGAMGFITCASAGVTFAPAHEKNRIRERKEAEKLNKQVDKFYNSLLCTEQKCPSFLKILTFRKQQKAFSNYPVDTADYNYWKDKGWLEKNKKFYYDAPIPIVLNILAKLIA